MSANPTWEQTLDRLEIDLDATTRLLDDADAEAPAPWTPPVGLDPIPQWLLPRATALLERQRDLTTRLARAASAAQRQREFTSKVNEATSVRPAPVYLDLEA